MSSKSPQNSVQSGQGGSVTLTSGNSTPSGGSVVITGGNTLGTTAGAGSITLRGGQPSPSYSHGIVGITPTDSGQWGPVVTEMHMDQLRLEMFDLQQTVKLLMRQNQRLSDEVEALKAGVILDDPNLA